MNDFSGDAFSLTNIRLGRKTHQMQANKHTSLFYFTVSGEDKKFDDIETQEERIISLKMLSQLSIDE